MEFVQSVTRCEAAAVFARPAAPLLLSHCINSRESSPKAWKRHTPLSLLQDPDTALIHEKQRQKRKKTQLKGNTLYRLFDIDFWCAYSGFYIQHKHSTQLSLQMRKSADSCVNVCWTVNRLTVERKNVSRNVRHADRQTEREGVRVCMHVENEMQRRYINACVERKRKEVMLVCFSVYSCVFAFMCKVPCERTFCNCEFQQKIVCIRSRLIEGVTFKFACADVLTNTWRHLQQSLKLLQYEEIQIYFTSAQKNWLRIFGSLRVTRWDLSSNSDWRLGVTHLCG